MKYLVFLLAFACCLPVLAQQTVTMDATPPVVVRTVPKAGDTAVDPGIQQISVTFSKNMRTKNNWSWVMLSKESFPNITGAISYKPDGRTCVAPVKLEPGKTYAIWLNTDKYMGFKDTGNHPAVPYLLVFSTKKK